MLVIALMGAKYMVTHSAAPTLNIATYNCQLKGYIDCDSNGNGHTCAGGLIDTGSSCAAPANPPSSSYDPKTGCPTGSTYNGQICVYQQQAQYGEIASTTATTPCQFLSFVTFDIVPCKPHTAIDISCLYGADIYGKCLAAPTQTVSSSTAQKTTTLAKPDCTGQGYDPTTNKCFALSTGSSPTSSNTPDCSGQGYDPTTNKCFDPSSVQTQIDLLTQKLTQLKSGSGSSSSDIQNYQNQINALKAEISATQSNNFTIPSTTYYWIAGIVIVIGLIVAVVMRKKS